MYSSTSPTPRVTSRQVCLRLQPSCYVPLAGIQYLDPLAFRVRTEKAVIIHLAISKILANAVFFIGHVFIVVL